MIWVLDHIADLEADFLRFYHIDNMFDLEGRKFFRLAMRVFAYGGVMAARLAEESLDTRATPITQTVRNAKSTMIESGAEIVQVGSDDRSYLHDLLKT